MCDGQVSHGFFHDSLQGCCHLFFFRCSLQKPQLHSHEEAPVVMWVKPTIGLDVTLVFAPHLHQFESIIQEICSYSGVLCGLQPPQNWTHVSYSLPHSKKRKRTTVRFMPGTLNSKAYTNYVQRFQRNTKQILHDWDDKNSVSGRPTVVDPGVRERDRTLQTHLSKNLTWYEKRNV